jgi:hypothetical protein
MIHSFIYESNQYALLFKLQYCPKVEVTITYSLDEQVVYDTPFGSLKRKGLRTWKLLSVNTESGQDVTADFIVFINLYNEMEKEVNKEADVILARVG